jgi:hypothetical protein
MINHTLATLKTELLEFDSNPDLQGLVMEARLAILNKDKGKAQEILNILKG